MVSDPSVNLSKISTNVVGNSKFSTTSDCVNLSDNVYIHSTRARSSRANDLANCELVAPSVSENKDAPVISDVLSNVHKNDMKSRDIPETLVDSPSHVVDTISGTPLEGTVQKSFFQLQNTCNNNVSYMMIDQNVPVSTSLPSCIDNIMISPPVIVLPSILFIPK